MSGPFDISPNPRLGDRVPIIGTSKPPISRAEDSIQTSDAQRARWAGRVYHEAEPDDRPPRRLEVVHRGPVVGRRHIGQAEMASDFATHAARQPAPSAISAEEVQALRVELQAQREVSARQARQIEALLAKLGLAEEGT